MLYVTTRNNRDAFTAQRILQDRRAADGGFYVPFRVPVYSEEEIAAFAEKNFNAAAAEVLNLLLNSRLTGYDLDLIIGRYSVRLEMLNQRIIMAECWHNPRWQFSGLVQELAGLICGQTEPCLRSEWVEVAVRIAVLFGIFGELFRQGLAGTDKKVDISVVSGDFSAPISAWYARQMGLPVGNIICSCNENGNLWNFICHGQLRTDGVAVRTCIPQADVAFPAGIERLICDCGGIEEVARFLEAVRQGKTYYAEDKLLQRLRQGFYVTVTSQHRALETIPNARRTHDYVLAPATALAYVGLQDYRAGTGECRNALVLAENSPKLDADLVAEALGCSGEEVEKLQ